jgi:hypothetical protein
VIAGRRPDPTLRRDDTTLDPGAVDRSSLLGTEAVSNEDKGGLVKQQEVEKPSKELDEEKRALLE